MRVVGILRLLKIECQVESGSRMHLIERLVIGAVRHQGNRTPIETLGSLLVLVRAIAHLGALTQLLELGDSIHLTGDGLFPIRHRYYLTRGMSLQSRIECAVSHYKFEVEHWSPSYRAAVYGGDGVALWRSHVGETQYSIVLRDTGDLRHEGPLSISLFAGTRLLHITSFSWVPGRVVSPSLTQERLLFVTRNQSARTDRAAAERFQRDFPQNSPAYFCMAAVFGIAKSHGQEEIGAVHHEYQIAYDAALAEGFRRSYCEFWRSFGGRAISSNAHLVPVPARLTPLESVPQKHRARARSRRQHWDGIEGSAALELARHRPGRNSEALRTAARPNAVIPLIALAQYLSDLYPGCLLL